MKTAAGLLLQVIAGLLLAGTAPGALGQTTYEMSIAANRPPCEGEAEPSARCRGTRGQRSTYDITVDTMLWFEQTQPAPVAFLFAGPLAVKPFTTMTPALGVGVHHAAHGGLTVEAVYGVQRVVQTVELDRWARIQLPPHGSFWIRIRRPG